MKTLRGMIYREVLQKVGFATLGFVALFFFFDAIDELKLIGSGPGPGYSMQHAMWYVVLMIPNHLYELLPITVLIGTIFVMARLAQSSEFTIMRTSGLGPLRALKTLMELGLFFVLLAFVVATTSHQLAVGRLNCSKPVILGNPLAMAHQVLGLKKTKPIRQVLQMCWR